MDIFTIITIATGISALIVSIITWIKNARMMPRDEKKADLENKSKEISIVAQYEEMATKATEKALAAQERLNKIEDELERMREEIDALQTKISEQDKIIKQQAAIIEQQEARLNAQQAQIASQEEIINTLKTDLNICLQYSVDLINQMREQNIVPREMPKFKTISEEQIEKTVRKKKQ